MRCLPLGAIFLLFFMLVISVPCGTANTGGRQINGGPYSLTLRGGAQGDSGGVGMDLRTDYLNPVLNLHLFGTYDLLDSSSSIGYMNNQKYGAGLAFSHTYLRSANMFVGASFTNELDEYTGHVYAGGKVKVSDWALITGAYGIGVGNEKTITKAASRFATVESVNWGKLGGTVVAASGLKTNLSYYLTDPGGLNISGVEGEISYPVTDAVSLGVNGGVDLTTKTGVDKNWRSYLLLAYSFGGQKGSPIDMALDKNSPVIYPVVIRKVAAGATVAEVAASTLSISPTAAINGGCSAGPSTFTASGGTAPYTWATDEANGMMVINATQAEWDDLNDDFCAGGATVTVTVTDSVGATAIAIITIP